MLARANLAQTINFFEDRAVLDVAVEVGGVRYEAMDVLASAGGQPLRQTLLDCFQEGAYDYFGTLAGLGAGALSALADEMLAPFGEEPGARRHTPYDWCLYGRLAVAYTPTLDPHQFGDCRKFVDGPKALGRHGPLAAAYDFHRAYAVDFMKSAPSLAFAWACRPPFVDEPVGRCGEFHCCDLGQIYAACALCEQGDDACAGRGPEGYPASAAACETYAAALGAASWAPNALYDAAHAALPACGAFDFYPVSSAYAAALGSGTGGPPSTDLTGCARAAAAGDGAETYVAALRDGVLCVLGGANACPAFVENDAAWELLGPNLATEDELIRIGGQLDGPCYLWDGGPPGLNVLPGLSRELTVGDVDAETGARALQAVYVSRGEAQVRDAVVARGGAAALSRHAADAGRRAWLAKFGRVLKGRDGSGSMLHGTYASTDTEDAVAAATVPTAWQLGLGYALVVAYAAAAFAARAPGAAPTAANRLKGGLLGLAGVACVVGGAAAGLGLGAYAGREFSALGVQVLPFLLLGLGVNDLFVFGHRFAALRGRRAPEDAVAAVVASAGASVTLTSLANVCAFAVAAAFVDVRIVSEFARLAAFGLFGTWAGVVVGVAACLGVYARVAAPRAPGAEHKARTAAARALAAYAGAVTSRRGRFAAVAASAAAIGGLAGSGLPRYAMGMPLATIFPENSSPAIFWETKGPRLTTNNFWLVTGAGDWPRKHPLLASLADPGRDSLLNRVVDAKRTNAGPVHWYPVFLQWCLPCGAASLAGGDAMTADEVRAACASSAWYGGLGGAALYNGRCVTSDQFGVPPGACGPRVSTATLRADEHALAASKAALFAGGGSGLAAGTIPACSAWPVQLLLCGGAPCFEGHLTPELESQIAAGATTVLGVHPDHFYACLNLFLNSDSAHGLTSPGWNCEDPARGRAAPVSCDAIPRNASSLARRVWRGADGAGDLDFAQSNVWARDLEEGKQWVTMIDSVRKALNGFAADAGVEAYPSGALFKFYSQFRWLPAATLRGLGAALAAIFGAAALFLGAGPGRRPTARGAAAAARVALVLAANVAAVVVAFAALLVHAGVLLNCFTAVTLVMSLGVAVEFLAHACHAQLAGAGGRRARAAAALEAYLPPVVDGACTTFLGFLALAFNDYLYIRVYYFNAYALMLASGLCVGAVTLPATLALAGAGDDEP